MLQPNPMQEQIIAKAMKEETFRQALLGNPKTVIERALGISVPQGVTIAVHQDTATTLHLVLPAHVQTATELSDAELEQATGGKWCEVTLICDGGAVCQCDLTHSGYPV